MRLSCVYLQQGNKRNPEKPIGTNQSIHLHLPLMCGKNGDYLVWLSVTNY